ENINAYFPESEREHLNSSITNYRRQSTSQRVITGLANEMGLRDGVTEPRTNTLAVGLLAWSGPVNTPAVSRVLWEYCSEPSHTLEFWVTLLDIPGYKELAEHATAMFMQIPTSYLCEQGFSALVLIKSKKMNVILNVDPPYAGTLESRLMPRFQLIVDKYNSQAIESPKHSY
ncbi:SCAN domain-containing protein 3-like 13, partial [Homarus americanus]